MLHDRIPMACPGCHRVLTATTVTGVTVDVCQDGCAGIWFDHGELAALRTKPIRGQRHKPFLPYAGTRR